MASDAIPYKYGERAKKAPKSNIQAPEKLQAMRSKKRRSSIGGVRAVLGSQRVQPQKEREIGLSVLPRWRPLRAEDGSRSGLFERARVSAAVLGAKRRGDHYEA